MKDQHTDTVIEDGTSPAQSFRDSSLSLWTGCSLFQPAVSFHLEQGAAMMMRAKGIPQASCPGENQADVSHWGGTASWGQSQRSLHRGPNRIRSRPRSLVAPSRMPSVHPLAAFSYLSLGAEKRDASHILLEAIVPVFLVISFLPSFLIILSLPFLFFLLQRAVPSTFTCLCFSSSSNFLLCVLSSAHRLTDPSHFLILHVQTR